MKLLYADESLYWEYAPATCLQIFPSSNKRYYHCNISWLACNTPANYNAVAITKHDFYIIKSKDLRGVANHLLEPVQNYLYVKRHENNGVVEYDLAYMFSGNNVIQLSFESKYLYSNIKFNYSYTKLSEHIACKNLSDLEISNLATLLLNKESQQIGFQLLDMTY